MRLKSGAYLGNATASHAAAGLALTETVYEGNSELPRHSHDAPYICLVVRGCYEESSGQRTIACSDGSVMFHPAGSVHMDRFGPAGGACFNIEFGAQWDDRLASAGVNDLGWLHLNGSIASLATRLRMESASQDNLSPLAIESLALSMLVEIGRRGSPRRFGGEPRWLSVARARLRDEFRAPPSLTQLSAEAGVEVTQFARMFRLHTGCTVGEYVRALRIERAKHLLAGATSLSSIALELGYADQAHFTRQFRKSLGVPPGAYRRGHSS